MKSLINTRQILLTLLALSWSLFAGTGAWAARIAGSVINGTNNNRPVPAVAIEIARPGFEREPTVVLAKVKTDAAGRFSVNLPDVKKDDLLTARINWQGFLYEIPAYDGAGQLGQFGVPAIKSDALELTIFDSTTTSPPLTFTVQHVAISVVDRDLKCIERIVVENPSSRTFIGEGPQKVTVKLPLPAGAENIELDPKIRSGKLVKTSDGYGVSLPLTPQKYDNRNAIIVNYTMPWKRGGIDLTRKLLYPVRFFFIAREEKDRKLIITAPQLGADENQSIPIDNQPQVRIINKKGESPNGPAVFEPGTTVSMNVSRPTNPLVWAFVAFVGALCLVVPLTLLRTRTPSGTPTAATTGEAAKYDVPSSGNWAEPPANRSVIPRHHPEGSGMPGTAPGVPGTPLAIPMLNPQLQECVSNIARLDDEWEAGSIARLTYQEQRAVWKDRAMQLLTPQNTEESR